MYYVDGKSILDILANMKLDNSYTDSITVSGSDLYLLDNERELLDMIPIIFPSDERLNDSSILTNDKYSTNITLNELVKLSEDTNYNKTSKKLMKLIPEEILNLFKINHKTNFFQDMLQEKLNRNETFHRNMRDSILYLNSLEKLDNEISKQRYQISRKDMSKLFSLQFRIIIPKYVYNIIKKNCECKSFIYLYKDYNKKMQILPYLNNKERMITPADMDTCLNIISQITSNGYEHLDLLPEAMLYNCYFNITFDELNNLINRTACIEEEYYGQVIGAIYYNLIHYTYINLLFYIDPQVQNDIQRRIHRRVGN